MAQTAQEKAKAALDVVDRKLAKAKARLKAAIKAIETAEAEVKSLTEEREYVAAHPALKSLEEHKAEATAKAEADDEGEDDESAPSLGF